MAETTQIVIIGAGVIGLTTALLLSKDSKYQITVVAKHMPGDYDNIEYASPWAGAHYLPVSVEGSRAREWERTTWPEFERLARFHPDAGIHFQNTAVYLSAHVKAPVKHSLMAESTTQPWYKDFVPNFKPIPTAELRPGSSQGFSFTSVCINPTIYLAWLVSRCLQEKVVFKRGSFNHISEAANVHHSGEQAELIVNCTGLNAWRLGGVQDKYMVPIRGQTVLVRNDSGGDFFFDDGKEEDEVCYIMQRAAGGGTLLGGCTQLGNWDSQVDPNLANRIMKRAIDLCPALTDGKGIEHLSVINHGVGLRPFRLGGPRLETETIDGVRVVHHYGHAGYGYQTSYGSSREAVKLVENVLRRASKL